MSIEISGKLVNLKLRLSGTNDAFKTLTCTESSGFDITSDVTIRRTNCGNKGKPADPEFTVTLDAVQNANPGATEIAYQELKAFMINKQKVDFQYISEADTANGIGLGDGIYNYGSAYISELGAAASADDDTLTYSVTLTGVGTLDQFDTES